MDSDLCISKLSRDFDRKAFDCGVVSLTTFLQEHAVRQMEQRFSTTYVLHSRGATEIRGYYTISMSHIELDDLPEEKRRKLPRHPVPAAKIGRLAVAATQQGKHYGMYLLMDAVRRIIRLSDAVGAHALEVDAIDENARRFYERFGFSSPEDDVKHLYLPLDTAKKVFEGLL